MITLFRKKPQRLPSKPDYRIGIFRPLMVKKQCLCGHTNLISDSTDLFWWYRGLLPIQCKLCGNLLCNQSIGTIKRYMESL